MSELLPCPFCGANNSKLCERPSLSWVTCINCGIEAPCKTGTTAVQAIAYWNTRAPAQAAPDPENILILTPEAHAAFIDACENPAPPTQALIDLMRDYGTKAPAQEAPEPVAWRLTDGEGDYEYLTEEPSDKFRAWSRRYGRKWEPLYASPVPSTDGGPAT